MTKQERDKLRELALAATPGEWEMASDLPAYAIYTENGWRVVQTPNQNNRKQWGTSNDTHGIGRFSDAAYIAAANPATLLALLDRIDELEGDAERYRWIRANCLSVTDLAATRIGASDEAIDKARGQ